MGGVYWTGLFSWKLRNPAMAICILEDTANPKTVHFIMLEASKQGRQLTQFHSSIEDPESSESLL